MASTVFPEGFYVSTPTVLSDTNETTCYTVPTGKYAYIQQLIAADTTGAARTLTVKYRKSGTDYTVVFQGAIAANNALDIDFKPLQLEAADSIKCTASAATVHVTINTLEYGQPRI